MRIIVFSDSHGNFAALRKIIKSHPSADMFIHLGDGETEFDDLRTVYPNKLLLGVRGNCDWASLKRAQGTIACAGKTVFYTHGHLFGVKSGLTQLKTHARDIGADIVLFGHTHLAMTEYDDGLYLLNPGSVARPARGGPSYGILDISETSVVPLIARL